MLIRAVILLVAEVLVGFLVVSLGPDDGGANIGAGLAGFLAIIVIAALWGVADGRTLRTRTDAVLVWVGAALIVGLVGSLIPQMFGEGMLDWAVWRSDLLTVGPFLFGLVAVPALLAALLGSATGRSEPT